MFRIGIGYDSHRLVEGRPLIIGLVRVPFELGPEGHSDGDVVAHALTDALLGAAALGDIGRHFSNNDQRWKDADSRVFLQHTISLLRDAGYRPVNVDVVVVLEEPKLSPHIEAMREALAAVLELPVCAVSVKAKTAEGLGAVGEGRAIEAHAIAGIESK
jgi:2-C-methyl-D-erythritol 2,4-cyclodiphosphate synthase